MLSEWTTAPDPAFASLAEMRTKALDEMLKGKDERTRARIAKKLDSALNDLGINEQLFNVCAAMQKATLEEDPDIDVPADAKAKVFSVLDTASVKVARRLVSAKKFEEARAMLIDAVARGAQSAEVFHFLGKAELGLRDFDPAQAAFERAIAINPEYYDAHCGLATVFEYQRRYREADAAWRAGFPVGAVTRRPYTGKSKNPVKLLVVNSVLSGNVRYGRFITQDDCDITTITAEAYTPQMELPAHDVVFQVVGDAELCPRALVAAKDIMRRTSAPFFNSPFLVERTSRAENAARLGRIPGVVTPRTISIKRRELLMPNAARKIEELGFTFPLLLRTPGCHTGNNFEFVEHARDLYGVARTLPGDEVLVLDYLNTQASDGTIRKYRVMRIGGVMMPLHLAVSHDWKVHYFSAAMSENEAFRVEEQAFLKDWKGTLGPGVVKALAEIFIRMGLDYGGIDFTIDNEGRVVVFEANATMAIIAPKDDPKWDYRRGPIEAASEAARRLILGPVRV